MANLAALRHTMLAPGDTIQTEFCALLNLGDIFPDIALCCQSPIVLSLPISIQQSGGSVGTYSAPTMSNAVVGTNTQYPRYRFKQIEIGKNYDITGQLSGDLSSLVKVRLAHSGSLNDVSFNPVTGVVFDTVIAAATSAEFVTNGTTTFNINIDSFVLCTA